MQHRLINAALPLLHYPRLLGAHTNRGATVPSDSLEET
jgi:hypothetical protein